MPIRIGIGIGISIGKIFSSVLGIESIGKKWYQSTLICFVTPQSAFAKGGQVQSWETPIYKEEFEVMLNMCVLLEKLLNLCIYVSVCY